MLNLNYERVIITITHTKQEVGTGVKSGMLMCETRATMCKESSQNKREGNWDNNRGGRRKARARGGGPRDGESGNNHGKWHPVQCVCESQ